MKLISRPKIIKGKWFPCYDVPNGIMEGHIVKANNAAKTPIASLWVGGGTHGKPIQRANTQAIAALPELLKALETALPSIDDLAQEYRIKAQRDLWRLMIEENVSIFIGGLILGAGIAALFWLA